MAEPALARRTENTRVPVLAMANRFNRYKPETEKAVRKVEVVEDETLRQLKKAWGTFKYDNTDPDFYNKAANVVKKLDYSASDVENFSLALAEFQDEGGFQSKAGVFLSALTNNGKDSDYVIHTAHLEVPVNLIGCFNTKNIVVNGDVGKAVGSGMKNGTITVNGNAGSAAGIGMLGGSITVEGNAADAFGWYMQGGEIHIQGEIGKIANDIDHGKIYHKGKLIVNK
ncbi:hypothetical protein H0O00_05110 [Candidatus Micrarchaeota archaeon]|nr:hypothetical protein [Candidatus Micrarchaeota archaeon]